MTRSTSSSATGPDGPHDAGRQALRPRRSLEAHFGAVILMALVLITLANVLVRYFTDQSFAWTEEISVFLLVVLTLAGAAVAAGRDDHIRIGFFYDRAGPAGRRVLAWLSALATVLMFSLLAVLMARGGWQEFQFEETTTGLGVPRWWYTVWLPVLALLVAVRAWCAARAGRAMEEREIEERASADQGDAR